jgi:hypothetical protein
MARRLQETVETVPVLQPRTIALFQSRESNTEIPWFMAGCDFSGVVDFDRASNPP